MNVPWSLVIGGFLLADGVVIALVALYLYGKHRGDRPPVLRPVDDDMDAIASNHALVTTVQYDATGNTEQFVILDDGTTTSWEAKRAIRDVIPGAEPLEIERLRLYRKGPAWVQATDTDDDDQG